MSALNLSEYEVVIRAGDTNKAKGLRRFKMLQCFDVEASRHLIEGLSEARGVTTSEVEQAMAKSVSGITSEKEAEWRRDFRPYALVRTGDGGTDRVVGIWSRMADEGSQFQHDQTGSPRPLVGRSFEES